MKVLLLKDIKGIGKNGEVVNVSEGYARNMLLPSKSALIATDSVLKQVKEKEAKAKAKEEKNIAEAKEVAKSISADKIVIKAKAGQNSKLFGAITNNEIVQAINEKYNINIDKKKVVIKDAIKTVGTYYVDVKLYTGVSATITIDIIAE